MGDATLWGATPLAALWHQAIAEIVTHQGGCAHCDPDGAPRCTEAQQLYDIEQAAWMASRSDQYAGKAVA